MEVGMNVLIKTHWMSHKKSYIVTVVKSNFYFVVMHLVQCNTRVTWHDVRCGQWRRGRWSPRNQWPPGGAREHRKLSADTQGASACVLCVVWRRAVRRRRSSGQTAGGHFESCGAKCCLLSASMMSCLLADLAHNTYMFLNFWETGIT